MAAISSLCHLPAWKKLAHYVEDKGWAHKNLLLQAPVNPASPDSQQAILQNPRLSVAGIDVDFSMQAMDATAQSLLIELAQQRHLGQARDDLLAGKIVNISENRAAWHTALRARPAPLPEIEIEYQRLTVFANQLRAQALAQNGIRHIVHIGIGGSDWGPRLAIHALTEAEQCLFDFRFVSNIDAVEIQRGLAGLDPARTLVIVSSKSFATLETLKNAQVALDWLSQSGTRCWANQAIAITVDTAKAQAIGFKQEHVFPFWEWVGGRFSIWSAIGLPLMLAIGPKAFDEFLAGAHEVDQHFAHQPFTENIPVQLALNALWTRNFLGFEHRLLAPYDTRLRFLPLYLQQLEMESLGKSVSTHGQPLDYLTAAAVWGVPGSDGQHTFFQWLHQGSDGAAIDFMVCLESGADHRLASQLSSSSAWVQEHHHLLVANCLAQREALARGLSYEQALTQIDKNQLDKIALHECAKQRVHPGGRPSLLFVLPRLNAYTLGALLALYEHKVFVQGVLWDINPFDQWGVEYGKTLAAGILQEISGQSQISANHDASTAYWINRFANS